MLKIFNHTHYSIKKSILEKDSKKLFLIALDYYQMKEGNVNIALITAPMMRDLCRDYLQKEDVTDILSFSNVYKVKKGAIISGDIAICLSVIKKDAKKDKKEIDHYLREIIIHGQLHLCGMTHNYENETLRQLSQFQNNLIKQSKLFGKYFNA